MKPLQLLALVLAVGAGACLSSACWCIGLHTLDAAAGLFIGMFVCGFGAVCCIYEESLNA